MTSGSASWQIVFVALAVGLILFELIRGWRLGLMRQLARLFGLATAYAAAIYGGKLLLPMARPFLKMPDSLIAIVVGAVLALLVYSVVGNLGRVLFRRGDQHESLPLRILSGFSGAAVGLFFGALIVWLGVMSIRSLGAVADGQIRAGATSQSIGSSPQVVHAVYSTASMGTTKNDPSSFVSLVARLKNSLELGQVGALIKRTDVIPEKAYDMLSELGQLLSRPVAAERFLAFPGARVLSENPKIVALRDDPEIADLIARGRVFDLLQNDKILDAANDPVLVKQVREFDLQQALDFATKSQ